MKSLERTGESVLPRIIIVLSYIIWGITEGLSAINALTHHNVVFGWTIICVLGIYVLIRKLHQGGVKKERKLAQHRDLNEKLILSICIGLAIITFILAIIIVPNNWDSMTYHLARVANWIENRSVKYYPTYIDRQLYYSSFTEYVILHICLLCRNDLYVNLVQWVGYIVSAVMIYRITNRLGCNRKSALIASMSFMLLPLAIAESVTTQVDLVASMWVLIFFYYVLLIGQSEISLNEPENLIYLFHCASAVGFGYLTKSSICFLMPAGLIWLLIMRLVKKENLKSIIMSIGLAIATLLVLLFPGFERNYKSTGDIFALNKVAGNLMFHAFSVRLAILNICKNITLEIAGKDQPDFFWKITMKLSEMFGIDIENPEISAYSGFSNGVCESYSQDSAGARGFMIIIIIMFLCVLIHGIYLLMNHKLKITLQNSFMLLLSISAALMFTIIRWQPWGVRLLLPAFPLLCICLGYSINRVKGHKIVLFMMVVCLMFPSAIGSIQYQYKRYGEAALSGNDRFDLYFVNRPIGEQYKSAIEYIEKSGAKNIGILTDADSYEYPIWVALKDESTTIHPIVLEEPIEGWHPQCIISVCKDMKVGETISYGEWQYQCMYQWNYESDYGVCSVLKLL